MMCSIRTAFLGSTFYTEPPRAMVKRKWAAWGKKFVNPVINWDGAYIIGVDHARVQADDFCAYMVCEGGKVIAIDRDDLLALEGMTQTTIAETHYMRDGRVIEMPTSEGLRASFQAFDRESERVAVALFNAP